MTSTSFKRGALAAAVLAVAIGTTGCASSGSSGRGFFGGLGGNWFGSGASASATSAGMMTDSARPMVANSGGRPVGSDPIYGMGGMSNAGKAASIRGPGDMSDYPAMAGTTTTR